jgi:hypothetical protein
MDISLATFEPVLKALALAGLPVLEQTLTQVVATTVAGPFGGLVTTAVNPLWTSINHALGLDANTPPDQTATVITADPAAAANKLAAVQEQHAYLLKSLQITTAADLASMQEVDRTALAGDAGQNALNAQAMSSSSFFVYGPRPAVMWGLGGLTMVYGCLPALGWFINGFTGRGWGTPPVLPWYVWLGLFALLGIVSALRSFDKSRGTASLPPAAPAVPVTAPAAGRTKR